MSDPRLIFNIDEEEGIDFSKWLTLFLSNWGFIFCCVLASFGIAFLLNKIAVPQYQVQASILVKESPNPLDKLQGSSALSSTFISENQLNNELGVLYSNALINRSIKKYENWITYSCREKGLLNRTEFFCPFTIEFDKYHTQLTGVDFALKLLSDTNLLLTVSADEYKVYDYVEHSSTFIEAPINFSTNVQFGESISDKNYQFTILPNQELDYEALKDYEFTFRFMSLDGLKNRLGNFEIDNSRNSSILTIKHRTTNPKASCKFINTLLKEYLAKGVERENQVATNTIGFIDNQLISITDSLSSSENQLESFRKQNKLLNVDFQAEQAFEKMELLQNERNLLLVKLSYIDYLKNSLQTETDKIDNLILPSTLNITDPVLNNLVQELVGLLKEYSENSVNTIKNTPYISSLEQKITYTKKKLLETTENISNITHLSLENNTARIADIEVVINKIPQDQRKLLNIERKFQLNDELYTFLLTKRSEMQIMKASNLPENEILDWAEAKYALQVFPNKKVNYLIALLLGLASPIISIILWFSINQKVRTIDELQSLTEFPIIAHILNDTSPHLLQKKQNSPIQESLRTLRANLQFSIQENQANVLMVTSAIPSEGKSYISTNLASTYALFGKKVCVADFDLRKGKLSQSFGLKKTDGISTYLSKRSQLDEILCKTESGFDILPAGSIPPNPGVLIASDKTKELFLELKKKYDVVVVDTPPIGIVSDALFLQTLADHILFVSRFNVSPKPLLSHVFSELKKKKVNHVSIIFNALPNRKRSYGYSYGYGYGYGYFDNESKLNKKNILLRASKIFKKRNLLT